MEDLIVNFLYLKKLFFSIDFKEMNYIFYILIVNLGVNLYCI